MPIHCQFKLHRWVGTSSSLMPTRFYYDYFETLQHIILCKRFLFQQIHLQVMDEMVSILKSVKTQNLSSGSLMSEICIPPRVGCDHHPQ